MQPKLLIKQPTDVNTFSELVQLFHLVFAEPCTSIPSPAYLKQFLRSKNFLVFTATLEEKVVAGLTAYVLPGYCVAKPTVFIYDVAVHPDHQKQGIGKKLIEALNQYTCENDCLEAFVAADAGDEPAISFYEKTAYSRKEAAVHFTYTVSKSTAQFIAQ